MPARFLRSRWTLRVLLALAAAGIVALVVVMKLTRPPAPQAAAPIQAQLELAAGEVYLDQGNGEEQATGGMALRQGAKVWTGKGARALVRLPDGSRLFLRDESKVQLDPDAVSLEAGEYWLDAPPVEREGMVHRLGGVELTAADSGLDIQRAGNAVTVYVARGRAVLSAKGGRLEVTSGQQATVKGDEAPAVAPVAFWNDWTGGMADLSAATGPVGEGSGVIYGVDPRDGSGAPALALQIKSQTVRAVIRDGLSETEVDQTFFNPGAADVEGWYWFTVPERASVTGFAVETDGTLVEGELIERAEAAAKYSGAKQQGHSPAILEWIDNRTYRARIFPVKASGTRRVVLRYLEMRPIVGGKLHYSYPMGRGAPVRIGELSLTADLGEPGTKMKLATLADARIEQDGRLVTMRRSGFTPRADFQLEATVTGERPTLQVARFATGGDSADYVMARYVPQVDWSKAERPRGDVVVVVDTSAAGDEAAAQLRSGAAEAILRALSGEDRFALVSLDVRATVLHPKEGLAAATDAEIATALEALAQHATGGATDLASLFDLSLGRVHGAAQPAIVYVGDGVPTSGEMTGEQLTERLRRALASSPARLFTVAVGPGADHALLGELARAGGGESLRIDDASETTLAALQLAAAMKVPTITHFALDLGAGLDEPLLSTSGTVSRGSEVVLLARTHHELPQVARVKGRLGGVELDEEVQVVQDTTILGAFVPRLWAAETIRRLLGAGAGPELERGRIGALGLEYGLMTPFTSFLALESERAYRDMGVKRRSSRLRGVRLSGLDAGAERNVVSALRGSVPATAIGCDAMFARKAPAESNERSEAPPGKAEPAQAPVPVAGEGQLGRDDALGNLQNRPAEELGAMASPKPSPTGLFSGQGLQGQRGPGGAPPAAPRILRQICSDAAGRPLAQRMLLWRKRLRTASTPAELIARHTSARQGCELPDWRAEQAFLTLLDPHITHEAQASAILAHFASRREVQLFLARLILRRAVDPPLIAAVERVLFGAGVRWDDVDRTLTEIEALDERIAKLKEHMARAPGDPNGEIRLVRLLVRAGKVEEAIRHGRRLREQGLMTVELARELGDLLSRNGHGAEAVRTYSDIVEFDPDNHASRTLLGDIFLARGWYADAYRQYLTTTATAPNDELGFLRLAWAAAGAGRVDEALRLERRVATAQGRPGPEDPRRWARLLSASRLSAMIAEPPPEQNRSGGVDGMKRKLKELQLFRGPSALVVLTWEDLGSVLSLATPEGIPVGDVTDAAPVGLYATLLSPTEHGAAELEARLRTLPRGEPLEVTRHDIVWDGKTFTTKVTRRELPADTSRIAL